MKQLPLPISWAFSKDIKDFVVSDCNRYAVKWLEQWPFEIQSNFVCLVGESGSGKTHLAHIWANRVNAEFLPHSNVIERWYELITGNVEQKYFVLDDADELKEDLFLFYLYNTIKEIGGHLLLTAKSYPNRWELKLDDVISRYRGIDVIRIQRPREGEMERILEKMLLQRGLRCDEEVLRYVVRRIERSNGELLNLAEKISESKRRGSNVTMREIRELLRVD